MPDVTHDAKRSSKWGPRQPMRTCVQSLSCWQTWVRCASDVSTSCQIWEGSSAVRSQSVSSKSSSGYAPQVVSSSVLSSWRSVPRRCTYTHNTHAPHTRTHTHTHTSLRSHSHTWIIPLPYPPPASLSHSPTLSLSHFSLSHSPILSLACSLYCSLSPACYLSPSLSLACCHSLSLSVSLSLSMSLSLSHFSLSLSLSFSLSCLLSFSVSLCLSSLSLSHAHTYLSQPLTRTPLIHTLKHTPTPPLPPPPPHTHTWSQLRLDPHHPVHLLHLRDAARVVETPGAQADGTHARAATLEDASVGSLARLVGQGTRFLKQEQSREV